MSNYIIKMLPGLKSWESDNWRIVGELGMSVSRLEGQVNSTTSGLSTIVGKIKISSGDKVSDYLNVKLIAGTGITLTKSTTGGYGSEILTVTGHVPVTLATNHGLGLAGQVLNMGTPSTCTAITTNAVTTTTHTHAITGFLTTLTLDGLSDVDATTPADDDVIMYDTTSGTWIHQALPVAGGAEPALGNPAVTGYVLSSTTAGVRSWVVQSGGTDEKAKVSANDTTAGYLNGKLTAGAGITLTEGTDGGDETLAIAASATSFDTNAHYTLSADLALSAGTRKLVYDTVVTDGNTEWDVANGYWLCKTSGYYGVNISCCAIVGYTGKLRLELRVDGVATQYGPLVVGNGSNYCGTTLWIPNLYVAATSYLEAYVYLGGSTSIEHDPTITWFRITRYK